MDALDGDPWTISSLVSQTGLRLRDILHFYRMGGRNEVWLLLASGRSYVIKVFTYQGIFGAQLELLIDRYLPSRAESWVVDADLEVPALIWRTPSQMTLWREMYSDPSGAQLIRRAKQVATMLAEIHSLDFDLPLSTLVHGPSSTNDPDALPVSPAQLMLLLLLDRLGINQTDSVEAGSTLVHGDVRLTNIIVTDIEAWLIDFETLGTGHPESDLAQIIVDVIAAEVRSRRVRSTMAHHFGVTLLDQYSSCHRVRLDIRRLAAYSVSCLISNALEYERGRERVALESLALIEMAYRLYSGPDGYERFNWIKT